MQVSFDSKIKIDGRLFFCYALVLVLVPFQWAFGWITAAVVHEIGHLIALKMMRVEIYGVHIGIFGAKIITGSMTAVKELISTVSGPFMGLSTILLVHHMPYIALSGLIQSCFNLLPVYPLDGGRILKTLLKCIFSNETTDKLLNIIAVCVTIFFVSFGVWLSTTYHLGALPVFFPAVPIMLAAGKNTLQSCSKNSTIAGRRKLRGN